MNYLHALALQQAGEVERGRRHLSPGDLEARGVERRLNVLLGVQVGAGRLGRAREELADALEDGVGERLGRE